ncbi:MAG: hypothetical protein GQ577_14105 [Woeseiaceae bacterium]|nr:hypothetical protein [Woeseiaceae bacterium]
MSTDATKKNGADNLVLMPDIYAEDAAVDEETVEVVTLAAPIEDISEGFNPYDTARLYKK